MKKLPDFDKLMWIAKHHPKAFDRLKERFCDEAINTSKSKNRQQLICLQHNLEQRLSLCETPNQRCNVAMTMMFDKFGKLATALNEPQKLPTKKGNIIPFSVKKSV